MDIIFNKLKNNVALRLQQWDLQQFIRLVIFIGGYILLRNLVQRELAKRQLQQQVNKDQERKERDLIEDPTKGLLDDAEQTKLEEPKVFGWGNKTRYRVQKQKEAFGRAVDKLKESQRKNGTVAVDSDEDIADLLEYWETPINQPTTTTTITKFTFDYLFFM